MPSALPSVACVSIRGVDATAFLQAQLAGDVAPMAPGLWQWNAWLTAQGRVRALLQLAQTGDAAFLAVLRGGDATALAEALARYRLRAQVEIAPAHFAGRAAGPLPCGSVRDGPDGLLLGYGNRSLELSAGPGSPGAAYPDTWHAADIRLGWPTLPAGEPRFLPPALDLERLGAVSIDKGCYPGQEIAARLHFRGGHKWRLARLTGNEPPPHGEQKLNNTGGCVFVLTAAGSHALAVVPVNIERTINILGTHYQVDSMFDSLT